MFTQLCYEHMECPWQQVYYTWAQWKPCCASATITSSMVTIVYTFCIRVDMRWYILVHLLQSLLSLSSSTSSGACCLYSKALALIARLMTFSQQKWLHECATMICYMYSAYLVYFKWYLKEYYIPWCWQSQDSHLERISLKLDQGYYRRQTC